MYIYKKLKIIKKKNYFEIYSNKKKLYNLSFNKKIGKNNN